MSNTVLPPSSISTYRTCDGALGVDVTKVLLRASGFAEGPLATAGMVTEINSAAKQVRSGAVTKRRLDRGQFWVNEQLVFILISKGTGDQSSGSFFGKTKKLPCTEA